MDWEGYEPKHHRRIITDARNWRWRRLLPGPARRCTDAHRAGTAVRKILYYRNPMGLADTSAVPKKTHGMDYLPVYVDEIKPAKVVSGKSSITAIRWVLPDTSPVPKQDSMGMDHIPVYADEQPAAGQIADCAGKSETRCTHREGDKQILTHGTCRRHRADRRAAATW